MTENVLIKGYRISYGRFGSANNGDDVVLIHGTPSSSLIWRKTIPHLVSVGLRVHVYDLLGFGLSERPWDDSTDTSMSGQVPILEALMSTAWKLDKAHIVAHDIGGGVAQRFSIFFPEKVQTLTLIDVVSFDSYPSKRTKEQMKNGLEALIKTGDDDHRENFREWLLSAVHDKEEFRTSGGLEAFLGYISGPVGQASLFQHQVRHYDPKHTMEIAPRLGELGKLPVQLIWGADDQWQVTDWAVKLHKAIPGSKLTILERAGHFSPEDQPDKIAELIVSLIKPDYK